MEVSMNLRKFYFISSLIISVFLFFIGVGILSYLGHDTVSANSDGDEPGDYLGKILEPFIEEKDSINILLLGGDKASGNTDTMMLVNFNQTTGKINVLSIPRDTKVSVKGSDVPKINSAYPAGGEKLAIETVSKLFNVKIKYYIYIDLSSFRKIIDILGGIDYNVPANMDYDDPTQNLHIHLKKGMQRLDGNKAEQFMRFRSPSQSNSEIKKYYDGSDLKRIDAQQNFIKEVIHQKANVYYITKLNSLVRVIYSNLDTNINMDDALKLAQNFSKLKIEDVQMFKVPGEAKYESNLWLYIHDREKTDEIIKEYFKSNSDFEEGTRNKPNTRTSAPSQSTKTKKAPAVPSENASAANNDPAKDNPSNSEAGIQGSAKPAP